MERKRPYWQVAVSLVFSILATAAFIILGVKAIGFLMPFVVGWIISAIATPLVNWLEKRLKIVKKLGTAMIVIMVIGLIVLVGIFCSQQDCSGSDRSDSELSGYLCTAGRGDARDRKYLIRCV